MSDSGISELIETAINANLLKARVAYPAIVEKFDATNQTVDVQITIMQIRDGISEPISILVGLPIIIPSVQGFHITMPIKAGDEVLCVFADRCIDSWWLDGKVSKQPIHRVHSISDGFAIIGVNSKPNVITNYATDDLVIRNDSGDQEIRLNANKDIVINTPSNVNVTCSDATIDCQNSTVNAATAASVTTQSATIDTGTMAITCSTSFTVNSPIIDMTGATSINMTSAAVTSTTPLHTVTGLLGCAGIGAGAPPVTGEAVIGGNTTVQGNINVTGLVDGVSISTHTHQDAENRATTPPN
jgi:hypothetical protein